MSKFHGMSGTGVIGRLGLFAVGLIAAFAAALGVGSLVEPADTDGGGGHDMVDRKAAAAKEGGMDAHGGHGQATKAPAGLAVAEDGYSLQLERAFFAQGERSELSFSISGADGRAVTRFDRLHERRMHLIVVRRDGTGFRHLHPEMDGAGTWRAELEFDAAGVYRVFADFSVGGEQHTLASDAFVGGGFDPRPLPEPAAVDSTEGYEVRLRGENLVAGASSSLTFAVAEGGHEVHGLDPYLGAKGHLVALREGDLAYLHVHPQESEDGHEHGGHGAGADLGSGGEIAFATSFPTAGSYRLYLQFKHEGTVRTVEFTVEVSR